MVFNFDFNSKWYTQQHFKTSKCVINNFYEQYTTIIKTQNNVKYLQCETKDNQRQTVSEQDILKRMGEYREMSD